MRSTNLTIPSLPPCTSKLETQGLMAKTNTAIHRKREVSVSGHLWMANFVARLFLFFLLFRHPAGGMA
jgi:hypothetical protein